VVAALVALVLGLAGCSDSPEYQPPAGALPAGTAQVSIGGQDVGTSDAVACTTIETVTTISTGEEAAGTTSAVDSAIEPTALFVKIRNLGGFTGNYWQDVDGEAEVDTAAGTFTITGRANGFATDKPSFRTAEDFEIKVAC